MNDIQGNEDNVLTFIRKLEEETNLNVESAKAVQRQLESQLESTLKQLELIEKQKDDAEQKLIISKDKNVRINRRSDRLFIFSRTSSILI